MSNLKSPLSEDDLVMLTRDEKNEEYHIHFSPSLYLWMKPPKYLAIGSKKIPINNMVCKITDYDSEWIGQEDEIKRMHPSDRPYIPYTRDDISQMLKNWVNEYQNREVICRFKVNGQQIDS